eukprot:GHVL01027035.1.p1 GENE.GHVL01027035.1~~GHVL01027035.1.p1  ORF type:complete len:258 (-),score=19.36 GHVL01027035.1:541-1314(-)
MPWGLINALQRNNHLVNRFMAVTSQNLGSKCPNGLSYLTKSQAKNVDLDLMSAEVGYTLEQLMELAGLSVSVAIQECYSVSNYPRVLVVCGPGNNGGDGLVAARHLQHFNYKPTVVYPVMGKNIFFQKLLKQLASHSIPVLTSIEDMNHFDLVVDAIFGFSYSGELPRPPFDALIASFIQHKGPIVSVDIPSGWDVERGDTHNTGFRPACLISLTAPKMCAIHFEGNFHFIGGRFVPTCIEEKFGLNLPLYNGLYVT